jgi:hypothetical protein
LLLVAAAALRANDSLAHARRAQELLDPAVWSRVLRIENDARLSRYPRMVHALVFELAGILWFYCDVDGTQSFSLRKGRLAEEKADFGPLLHDIEPGFRRWRVEPAGRRDARPSAGGELPNGCFIESLAAWRKLAAAGFAFEAPRLLSFYHDTPAGRQGHTVLTYALPDAVVVRDPAEPDGVRTFSAELGADALELACALEGVRVTKARWVPVELPGASRGTTSPAGGVAAEGNAATPQSIALR